MVRINKNCDIQGTPAPTSKFNITGIGTQYDPTSPFTDNYYILPRYASDVTVYNGINETGTLNNVSLYPNPANGYFFIRNSANNKLLIEVYNIFGQLINISVS